MSCLPTEAHRALDSPEGVHAALLILPAPLLPLTPQHSEEEPCWSILRVARGQARMDIGAVCRGELFSNRSPWQQPHSSGRSHIPRPVSGTRRACWQSLYCSTQHSWGGRARKGCSEPSQQEDMCTEYLASWEEGSKQSWPPETPGMEEASRQLPRKNRNASWRDPLAEPNQNHQLLPTDLLKAQILGISEMIAVRKT